jgi:hypothetical protein
LDSTPDFPYRLRTVRGVAVVGFSQQAAGTPLNREGLGEQVGLGCPVVFDLPADLHLSSSLMGGIIRLIQQARLAGTQLRICCPDSNLRQILSIVRVDRLVSVHATLDAALEGLDPPPGK